MKTYCHNAMSQQMSCLIFFFFWRKKHFTPNQGTMSIRAKGFWLVLVCWWGWDLKERLGVVIMILTLGVNVIDWVGDAVRTWVWRRVYWGSVRINATHSYLISRSLQYNIRANLPPLTNLPLQNDRELREVGTFF